MAWSTREIAELSGTTKNAVGHALQALYSSAQLDVLKRAHELGSE